MRAESRTTLNTWFILMIFILAALSNLFVFSLGHARSWKDAEEYNAYAVNMLTGHGYSENGTTFSSYREPGYPLFLAIIYKVTGLENFAAVTIIQALLLSIFGLIIFLIFSNMGERTIGFWAGLVVTLLPSYGLYSNEILTEMLFTFLLGVMFLVCVKILSDPKAPGYGLWVWLGILCAYTTLVRAQLVFFLFFLLVLFMVYARPWSKQFLRQAGSAVCVFLVLIGAWALFVHEYSGSYAITSGRVEMSIYIRAVRAKLTYSQLTQYAIDGFFTDLNSSNGTPLFTANDYHFLQGQYAALISSSTLPVAKAIKEQESRDIATILSHPGQYLYGNFIAMTQLLNIEPAFAYVSNHLVRRLLYLVLPALYLFCLFGLGWTFFGKKGQVTDVKRVSILAFIFIIYNILITTPFDAISRYNTPYLAFYCIIGFCGVVIMKRRMSV